MRGSTVGTTFPDDTIQFAEWLALTPEKRRDLRMSPTRRERFYQRERYLLTRTERAEKAQARWWNDAEYREREIRRAQDRRALQRAEVAGSRFMARCVAVADDADKPHRPPTLVKIGTQEREVFSVAYLALRCGRRAATVRQWVEDGVLPGVSAVVGHRAKFTETFILSVAEACRRVLELDGRGDHKRLRLLVIEELERAHESYVPVKKMIAEGNERPGLVEAGARVRN